MKELKRTETIKIRCSKEFLQLIEQCQGTGHSISDVLHKALERYAHSSYLPARTMPLNEFTELAQSVGFTSNMAQVKKAKEYWNRKHLRELKKQAA